MRQTIFHAQVFEFWTDGTISGTVEYRYTYESEGRRVYFETKSPKYADLLGIMKDKRRMCERICREFLQYFEKLFKIFFLRKF